uniref:ATPase n=1 Tax=uncultured prokaryote TaxID=198431 RepID=H5S977_9ZZZZ|nr:ATPase [uncultured prokaryote]
MNAFVNRHSELEGLESRWRSGQAELVIVYGRRRVGKTELLLRFAQEKRALYFLAAQATETEHLRQFSHQLRTTLADPLLEQLTLTNWESALAYLAQQAQHERLLVVLDEFPYLCEAQPTLPSLLQRFWDLQGQRTQLFLVLCGSHVSFMERELLAQRAPLYGRRTAQLQLQPLSFRDASLFFTSYTPRQRLAAYGVLGGMPAYLQRFDPRRSLRENLVREVLNPQGFLFEEPHFVLRMELRDPKTYMALLGAIAAGCTRLNEIAQRTGLAVQTASKYLDVLRGLGLVAREVSLWERAPQRSKKGRYRIADPFLQFWFRFVAPYLSLIAAGSGELVYERFIAPQLDAYLGTIFEEVCREYMRRYGAELGEPPAQRVGAHWGADFDIDVVIEHIDGSWSFGECKWTRRPMGTQELVTLQERVTQLQPKPRKIRSYLLFSGGGFTEGLRESAQAQPVHLVDLSRLLGV